MADQAQRWEVGSDFHADGTWSGPSEAPWDHGHAALWGAGRDPVIALAEGRRLWVPSYFCQDVVASWQRAGLEVRAYADSPLEAPGDVAVPAEPGDAVVTVAYFGVRDAPRPKGDLLVLEDHTHDPWSPQAFDAPLGFASLRKTLPVPDGAVAWSAARPMPEPPPMSEARAAAVLDRLTGMQLKARFLAGEPVDKDAYRAAAVRGEEALGDSGPSTVSDYSRALLRGFDFARWREQRRANWRHLAAVLRADGVDVLGDDAGGRAPFSAMLVLPDRETRDGVRSALIAARVYPAILWTLDEVVLDVPEEHRELAGRMLSLHCDGRYGPADLDRVAAVVREALA